MDLNAVHFGVANLKQSLMTAGAMRVTQVRNTSRAREDLHSDAQFQDSAQGYIPEDPVASGPDTTIPQSLPAREYSDSSSSVETVQPESNPVDQGPIELQRGADGHLYGVRRETEQSRSGDKAPQSRDTERKDPADIAKEARRTKRKQVDHANPNQLSRSEREQLRRLKQRDQEVRLHEMAHMVSAGPYASGPPSFTYQVGPDGKRYAIGGEVNVDTAPEETPEATILKMQTIRRASVSTTDQSVKDVQVAAQAAMTEMRARAQIRDEHFVPLGKTLENSPYQFPRIPQNEEADSSVVFRRNEHRVLSERDINRLRKAYRRGA